MPRSEVHGCRAEVLRTSLAFRKNCIISFYYNMFVWRCGSGYMDPEIMRILVHSKRQAQLGMSKAEVTIFFSHFELT